MKFHLVPIGEQFVFQEKLYTKSGPIAASSELEGKSRMIPRSANVTLSNPLKVENVIDVDERTVLLSDVVKIFESYNSQYHQSVEKLSTNFTHSFLDVMKSKNKEIYSETITKLKTL